VAHRSGGYCCVWSCVARSAATTSASLPVNVRFWPNSDQANRTDHVRLRAECGRTSTLLRPRKNLCEPICPTQHVAQLVSAFGWPAKFVRERDYVAVSGANFIQAGL
jgi:hypothetical protein